ncbi:hypothetical protein [Peribacillus muralis]|uniref:hypothetical protein n=1 Tax=Peribacillus muralis TaxID=264697 RepID=UPI003671F9FA
MKRKAATLLREMRVKVRHHRRKAQRRLTDRPRKGSACSAMERSLSNLTKLRAIEIAN